MDLNLIGWLAAGIIYIVYGILILRKKQVIKKINDNETEIRFISLRRRIVWAIFWPIVLAVQLAVIIVGLIAVAILEVLCLIHYWRERRRSRCNRPR